MRQLAKSSKFTLIELLLALVILVIGFQGFVSLFSTSLDSSHAAIGQTNSTDAIQQFLYLISDNIKDDWAWTNAFPTEKGEINDTWVGWSDNLIVDSSGVKIDFMSDMAARTVDDMVNSPSINEEGVFRIRHFSSDENVDFSAKMRVWKKEEIIKRDCGEENIVVDFGKKAIVYAEISWPAEIPYNEREKETYSINVFQTLVIPLDCIASGPP